MALPFDDAHVPAPAFGGPAATSFEQARAVVLPVALDSTGMLEAGPGAAPHAVLAASAHLDGGTHAITGPIVAAMAET